MKITKSRELAWVDRLMQGKYANRRKELSNGKIAAGLWELPPGKRSFPMHAHAVTEEALFVVSGNAQVRTPEGLSAIGPGDWVSFPAGGPAHQLVNDGKEPLIYVAVSVNAAGADVVEYPETGKVACSIGAFPTGRRMMFKVGSQVEYMADDPDAKD